VLPFNVNIVIRQVEEGETTIKEGRLPRLFKNYVFNGIVLNFECDGFFFPAPLWLFDYYFILS